MKKYLLTAALISVIMSAPAHADELFTGFTTADLAAIDKYAASLPPPRVRSALDDKIADINTQLIIDTARVKAAKLQDCYDTHRSSTGQQLCDLQRSVDDLKPQE